MKIYLVVNISLSKKCTAEMCFPDEWTWHMTIGTYTIKEVVSTNAVKLQLPTLMRIYLVVNIS